jgi:hypothetical protein
VRAAPRGSLGAAYAPQDGVWEEPEETDDTWENAREALRGTWPNNRGVPPPFHAVRVRIGAWA